MNLSGSKLSDPKISITKQNSEGVYEAFLDSDDFGDHSSATTYPSYSTGNSKEPAVVVDMAPGTYGVRVEDAGGSAGNANVEFYEVDGRYKYFPILWIGDQSVEVVSGCGRNYNKRNRK